MQILQIKTLLLHYSSSLDSQQVEKFTYGDRDNVFFCDIEGTGPTYEVTDESAFVVRVENDEVDIFRLYCGTCVDDLTVVSPIPVNGLPLGTYAQGYLASYLKCMFESGHIE